MKQRIGIQVNDLIGMVVKAINSLKIVSFLYFGNFAIIGNFARNPVCAVPIRLTREAVPIMDKWTAAYQEMVLKAWPLMGHVSLMGPLPTASMPAHSYRKFYFAGETQSGSSLRM